ncbi:1-acyl-sn-glycerol-3-phosphate acyltransferase [Candidatus Woesearchaeota archaeon]|nr:1-acyl-sn-glycerol-3-phosphate acyltransferase [Candidatus Woesearchaeota archaeon]
MSNHKSHLDYCILSLILRQNGFEAPAIGVGSNLFICPFGDYIRKLKAFPIERTNDEFKSREGTFCLLTRG